MLIGLVDVVAFLGVWAPGTRRCFVRRVAGLICPGALTVWTRLRWLIRG